MLDFEFKWVVRGLVLFGKDYNTVRMDDSIEVMIGVRPTGSKSANQALIRQSSMS